MRQPSTNTLTANLCCEIQLLLGCARTSFDTAQAERIESLLRQNIDWCFLTGTAFQHGLAPLLYQNLSGTFRQSVPKPVLGQLQAYFHANALRNLALTRSLISLLEMFEDEGIPVIPFKGPLLASAVYGDLSLRQFSDLDVLVHQRDLPRACDLLLQQGYTWLHPPRAAAEYHHTFIRADGPCPVELHWAFTPKHFSWPCDLAGIWERLEPVSLAGKIVRSLAPEDLLSVLCVHGAKHCWERLEWICGVAELIRVAQTRDWERAMEQAARAGQERVLLIGLLLAQNLLDAALPEPIARRLTADPATRTLAERVCHWLFEAEKPPGGVAKHAFFLSARERKRDWVRYVLHHLGKVNERDQAVLPLPGFLYYLLRPFRLLVRHGNPRRVFNRRL